MCQKRGQVDMRQCYLIDGGADSFWEVPVIEGGRVGSCLYRCIMHLHIEKISCSMMLIGAGMKVSAV